MTASPPAAASRLTRPMDAARDHVRGGDARSGVVAIVLYGDYLCPYCRRLRMVLARLRETLGERLAYVFRHFPNEGAHPGATFFARAAEAAGRQGRFWDMHDWLYERSPPLAEAEVLDAAREMGLDLDRFARDLAGDETARRVEADLAEGRRDGVTGTPTLFVDGERYDGAWDYHSMVEALQRPVARRLERSARAFANLPASGGLMLLVAAGAALVCRNSPLAPLYDALIEAEFGVGPPGGLLSMSLAEWCSEGLLAVFFALIGLEIRREITTGELSDPRAAILPVLAAFGGVIAPALIYLGLNAGGMTQGWAVPTATDIAFTLGILAVLGPRAPTSLRVFVAALAVVDDVISVLTLAIFYPQDFEAGWLPAAAAAIVALALFNRARIYATWPYLLATAALWLCLHAAGVHGALAGVFLAAFLPTRPAPVVSPLLAQAATALAALEQAETEAKRAGGDPARLASDPVWDWASRNLSAASERLLSPAERFERAVSPWSAYVILPLFAFSASGVSLDLDLGAPGAGEILTGVIAGLVVGKPLGIALAVAAAVRSGLAVAPGGTGAGGTGAGGAGAGAGERRFLAAACLCGIGYTVALLMSDQAFPDEAYASIAKTGVLVGSAIAAALGVALFASAPAPAAAALQPPPGRA